MFQPFTTRRPTPSVGCRANRLNPSGWAQAAASWRLVVVALALIAGTSLVGCSGSKKQPGDGPPRTINEVPAKPGDGPPPFDATAAAWKKAGAQVGWMGVNQDGGLEFRTEAAGLAGLRGSEVLTRRLDGALLALFTDKWRLAAIQRDHQDVLLETLVAGAE